MVKSIGLNTNRFLTPDSIVPDPTNPQSYNRYSYAYNSPIMYNDPDGHNPCLIPITGSIICSIWQNMRDGVAEFNHKVESLTQSPLKVNVVDGIPTVQDRTPAFKALGGTFSAIATASDSVELGVSYLTLAGQTVSTVGGPVTFMGVTITGDAIETVIGAISTFISTGGDILQGGTYIDTETGHLILGQGLTLNILDLIIDMGCQGPPGPACDASTNTAVLSSDVVTLLESLGIEDPNTTAHIGLELHFDPYNEDSSLGYINIYSPSTGTGN